MKTEALVLMGIYCVVVVAMLGSALVGLPTQPGTPGPANPQAPDVRSAGPAPRPRILGTGYGLLNEIGGEEPGYGLYSYALVVKKSDRSRSTKFLNDVFSVEGLPAPHSQLNLLSIPLKKNKAEELSALLEVNDRFLGFERRLCPRLL
jgi:hypothetical protein